MKEKGINNFTNKQMDILYQSIGITNMKNIDSEVGDRIDVNLFTVNILWYVAKKEN